MDKRQSMRGELCCGSKGAQHLRRLGVAGGALVPQLILRLCEVDLVAEPGGQRVKTRDGGGVAASGGHSDV